MSFFDDLKLLFIDDETGDDEEVEEVEVEQINDKKSGGGGFFEKFSKVSTGLIVVVILIFYLSTGVYKVGPKEVGVVKRFGEYTRQTESGLHYHLPYPFETVHKPKVTEMRRIELGFRTIDPGPPAEYRQIDAESLMLTGDLAIVSANAVVKYRIKDPIQYLFWIKNPNETVKDAAEAALRQVVGQNGINDVLTNRKTEIQLEAQELLQELLDEYRAGINVNNFLFQDVEVPGPVKDAYRDVASAKEDKQRKINEAEAYRNKILPEARGQASEIVNQAEGYKEERVTDAQGEVARFNQLLARYELGEDVTRTRLYLETMEDVLPDLNKIIVGSDAQGVLKMLNLDKTQLKGGQN
jgi:membrane protease subunit HflK